MAITAERQWIRVFHDDEENPLPVELPTLVLFYKWLVKTNFDFEVVGDAILDPTTWNVVK